MIQVLRSEFRICFDCDVWVLAKDWADSPHSVDIFQPLLVVLISMVMPWLCLRTALSIIQFQRDFFFFLFGKSTSEPCYLCPNPKLNSFGELDYIKRAAKDFYPRGFIRFFYNCIQSYDKILNILAFVCFIYNLCAQHSSPQWGGWYYLTL